MRTVSIVRRAVGLIVAGALIRLLAFPAVAVAIRKSGMDPF